MTFLYLLTEPTGEPRYIGKSNHPRGRFNRHIFDAKKAGRKNRRESWILSLLRQGKSPKLEVLFEIPKTSWEDYEKAYIKIFQSAGCDLVNATEGGDAGPRMLGNEHPLFGKKRLSKVTNCKTCDCNLTKENCALTARGCFYSHCRRCSSRIARKNFLARLKLNPEIGRESKRKWKSANLERAREYQRNWRAEQRGVSRA